MNNTQLRGGCLCGNVQYIISAQPFGADHCHCSMCRKTTGAVVASWMDFKIEQVDWLTAPPKEYASSATTRRGFCPNCGASISFRDDNHPDYLSLTIASLDNPDAVQPTAHIYVDDKVSWLSLNDDCKYHTQGLSSPLVEEKTNSNNSTNNNANKTNADTL